LFLLRRGKDRKIPSFREGMDSPNILGVEVSRVEGKRKGFVFTVQDALRTSPHPGSAFLF
jgi:hypothetical protein